MLKYSYRFDIIFLNCFILRLILVTYSKCLELRQKNTLSLLIRYIYIILFASIYILDMSL